VRDGDWLRALWESDSVGARIARAALTPAELAFAAATALRSSMYSSGILHTHPTAVPALSVGNLSVGGTGKTPLAAYLARRLRDSGATPAIVLRGYGEDEPLVHRTLNADVPVIVSADRVGGIADAKQQGCDVVVLDDAFQHRRASRVADIVVVSADNWHPNRRHLLPAGPWRERLTALRRATIAVVTRKAATGEVAHAVAATINSVARIPIAIVQLAPAELRDVRGSAVVPIDAIRGESIVAVSAIGDPLSFAAQLGAAGATVTSEAFRDHYRFTPSDVSRLVAAAQRYDRVVCTLKDAVKLGPLWPAGLRLWYVSQRISVERGSDAVESVLSTMLLARSASTHTGRPGAPRP